MNNLYTNHAITLMGRLALGALLGTMPLLASAQGRVGIGTTTPVASALLDLTATDKGLLAPRMTATDRGNIPSPAAGLLVYQTDGVQKGFWYYEATAGWTYLAPATNTWGLTGNAGTTPGSQFLGTTDNQDVVFKVNNAETARLKTNGALWVGVGTASSSNAMVGTSAGLSMSTGLDNTFLGYAAGAANNGNSNTLLGYGAGYQSTGSLNTAVGTLAASSLLGGSDNTLIGASAGANLTTGTQNTALGRSAGTSMGTSSNNVYVGYGSGNDATGGGNTGIGASAGRLVTTGSQNTYLGLNTGQAIRSGSNNTFVGAGANAAADNLTNATAIGYNSVVGASNAVVLGGDGSSATFPLVSLGLGVQAPLTRLSITPGTTEAKITLFDGGSSTAHYGFGISSNQQNYHVAAASASHVFYAGGKNGDGTELVRIKGDGKTGVGTSAPATRLEVAGDLRVGIPVGSVQTIGQTAFVGALPDVGQSFVLADGGTLTSLTVYSNGAGTATLRFYDGSGTAGTVRSTQSVTFAAGGPMAIPVSLALTAGTYTFAFSGGGLGYAVTTDATAYPNGTTYTGSSAYPCDAYFLLSYTSAGITGLTVTTAGRVGIGTYAPTQALQVVGNICYTGTSAACSDGRYKKDIEVLPHALANVLRMRGVSYNWRREEFPNQHFTADHQIGFIAQEVEKLYPEMVLTNADGYKSVDYAKLTPVLVEAIKELATQNAQLQTELGQARADARQANADLNQRLKVLEDLLGTRAAR